MSSNAPTERLYSNDSYLKTFRSKIEAVEEKDHKVRVRLTESAFYPTSGGQPCDFGHIETSDKFILRVTDVAETDDHNIWHTVEVEDTENKGDAKDLLKVGCMIEGHIDWPRRFRNMQQHSGQHLLSAIISKILNLDTTSVHLGATSSIDFDGSFGNNDEEIKNNFTIIETEFNNRVFECRKVTVSYTESKPTNDDTIRSKNVEISPERGSKLAGAQYRMITIDGVDACGCCGTHVSSTGEIGPLILLATQKARKNQTRLTYVVGIDAVEYARKQRSVLQMLDKTLDTRMEDMNHVVKNLMEGRKTLKKELEQSQKICAELFCDLSYGKAEERINSRTGSTFKIISLDASPMRPFEEIVSQLMKKYDRAVFVGISRCPSVDVGSGSTNNTPHKIYLSAQRDLDCGACVKSFKGILTLTCKPAKDAVVSIVSRGNESSLPSIEELITALFETECVH